MDILLVSREQTKAGDNLILVVCKKKFGFISISQLHTLCDLCEIPERATFNIRYTVFNRIVVVFEWR